MHPFQHQLVALDTPLVKLQMNHERSRARHIAASSESSATRHVPCKFFRSGLCSAGTNCSFSHSLDPNNTTSICKYFLKGSCKFGENCALAHVQLEHGTTQAQCATKSVDCSPDVDLAIPLAVPNTISHFIPSAPSVFASSPRTSITAHAHRIGEVSCSKFADGIVSPKVQTFQHTMWGAQDASRSCDSAVFDDSASMKCNPSTTFSNTNWSSRSHTPNLETSWSQFGTSPSLLALSNPTDYGILAAASNSQLAPTAGSAGSVPTGGLGSPSALLIPSNLSPFHRSPVHRASFSNTSVGMRSARARLSSTFRYSEDEAEDESDVEPSSGASKSGMQDLLFPQIGKIESTRPSQSPHMRPRLLSASFAHKLSSPEIRISAPETPQSQLGRRLEPYSGLFGSPSCVSNDFGIQSMTAGIERLSSMCKSDSAITLGDEEPIFSMEALDTVHWVLDRPQPC